MSHIRARIRARTSCTSGFGSTAKSQKQLSRASHKSHAIFSIHVALYVKLLAEVASTVETWLSATEMAPQELHHITSHHVSIRRSVITNNVQDSSNSSTTEGRGVVVRVKSHLRHLMYYSAVLYSLWTAEIVASYYLTTC
jgi:hypothetical protein